MNTVPKMPCSNPECPNDATVIVSLTMLKPCPDGDTDHVHTDTVVMAQVCADHLEDFSREIPEMVRIGENLSERADRAAQAFSALRHAKPPPETGAGSN